MEKLKSSFGNMALALTLVAVAAGGTLAWVNHVTEGPIKLQAEKTLAEAIKDVMNTTALSVASTDTVAMKDANGDESKYVVYSAVDGNGKPIGWAVESVVMGFGGNLKVLTGFSPDGIVLGYRVLQSSETPGLGQKAGQWFQKDGKGCIIGRDMSDGTTLMVTKDGGDVDAITASTITSRALLKAVNRAFDACRKFNGGDITDAKTGASRKSHGEKPSDGSTGASASHGNGRQASDGTTGASSRSGCEQNNERK